MHYAAILKLNRRTKWQPLRLEICSQKGVNRENVVPDQVGPA
jgi:hypothetical protein